MLNFVWLDVYIDKNKDIIMVPVKLTEAGFGLPVEPYKKISHIEWGVYLNILLNCWKKPLKGL